MRTKYQQHFASFVRLVRRLSFPTWPLYQPTSYSFSSFSSFLSFALSFITLLPSAWSVSHSIRVGSTQQPRGHHHHTHQQSRVRLSPRKPSLHHRHPTQSNLSRAIRIASPNQKSKLVSINPPKPATSRIALPTSFAANPTTLSFSPRDTNRFHHVLQAQPSGRAPVLLCLATRSPQARVRQQRLPAPARRPVRRVPPTGRAGRLLPAKPKHGLLRTRRPTTRRPLPAGPVPTTGLRSARRLLPGWSTGQRRWRGND